MNKLSRIKAIEKHPLYDEAISLLNQLPKTKQTIMMDKMLLAKYHDLPAIMANFVGERKAKTYSNPAQNRINTLRLPSQQAKQGQKIVKIDQDVFTQIANYVSEHPNYETVTDLVREAFLELVIQGQRHKDDHPMSHPLYVELLDQVNRMKEDEAHIMYRLIRQLQYEDVSVFCSLMQRFGRSKERYNRKYRQDN